MGRKREHFWRYIFLGAFFAAVCLVFIARLINIQIAGQDYYSETLRTGNISRTVKIRAQRGCIYDRNGKALVSNTYTYDIYFDAGTLGKTEAEKNSSILELMDKTEKEGATDRFTMPEHPFVTKDGKWTLDSDYMQTVYGKRLSKLLQNMNFTPESTDENGNAVWKADDIDKMRSALRLRYGLCDKEEKELYDEDSATLLFCLRLDMELHNFSTAEPYTVLKDVSVRLISAVSEGNVRGIGVSCEAQRVYNYPGIASHMLGRTGKITAENAEYYTEKGYSLDAIVGISGAEKAFEEYLHGEDGTLTVVEDEYGNTVDQYVSKEPVAGRDVYLTFDVDFQAAAETALKSNIELIASKAEESGVELSGEDAKAGVLTAVNRKTGEVLALASYPTYDLSTFAEDYKELANDTENTPLLFRALDGIYEPGSTFKPGVAVAALQEGIITPYTEIQDKGQYDYYAPSYTPRCWIYSAKYGMQTHGMVNVSKAIQVSCNYFFYDVGRQLTITKMNEYCVKYGLGQSTGIELDEKTGVLAGPAEREASGNTWYDGDTLQAAIGQSDNLFTPLQISMYISTLLNGGDRIGAHLLKEVKSYSGDTVYTAEPKVLDSVALDSENVTTVKYAMKDVTENGSAARVFVNYPISIGGKTGTAQTVKTRSDNALFTAFAPFDDPEIVATCIIENGANGTDAGFAIRDVFNAYFGLGGDTSDEGGDDTNG